MRKILLFMALAFPLLTTAQSNAKRALFIGNSYTFYNDMPGLVKSCARSVNDTLFTDQNTISGYTWKQHASNATTLSKIKQGGFDHVILQANSLEFTYDDNTVNTNTLPYAKFLDSLAHAHNPCAQNIFYNTWGRKNGSNGQTYLQQDTLIQKRYKALAMSRSAMISPAGPVRRYLRTNFPGLELYDPDESHPSPAGSYLSAVCFYTVIFRKDPTLITYNFTLSANDANTIKQAVKLILFNELQNWNVGLYDPAMPVADFSIASNETSISLSNTSSDATDYWWEFGDNTSTAGFEPTHTYAANGTYNVQLTASYCQLKNSTTKQVTVSTVKPIITTITQTPPDVFPSDAVTISAIVTDNISLNNVTLFWGTSTGDLTNSVPATSNGSSYTAVISPQSAGTTIYYKIVATDSDNHSMESMTYSYVVQEAIVLLTPSSVTINRSAQQQFTVSATDLYGNPVSFTPTWTTTGGSISSGGLLYAPATPGTYTVTATQPGLKATGRAQIVVSEGWVIPGKIESENYTTMLGLQTESTTDAGGGLNVGYTSANDWMTYDVNVLQSGPYIVSFRVASTIANARMELFSGAASLGVLTIPTATDGWQNWQTYTMQVTLTAGPQVLKFVAKTDGFNINWMNFTFDDATLGTNNPAEVFITSSEYLSIAPNPFAHTTVLHFRKNSEKVIQIFSVLGNLQNQITTQADRIEIGAELQSGIYFIRISDEEKTYSVKIEKQ